MFYIKIHDSEDNNNTFPNVLFMRRKFQTISAFQIIYRFALVLDTLRTYIRGGAQRRALLTRAEK